MAQQELTRRAMYDLVWSKPMTKLAGDFGISDVALKKICRKHHVPTPPRGYWAKKEAGVPVEQISLHEGADPAHECIVINGWRTNLAPEILRVLDGERERRKTAPKTRDVAGAAGAIDADDVHASVAATARALRKAKPDADQVVHATVQGHCGIEVGSASIERVISVLDAIARALEKRGLPMEPSATCMCVTIPPDTITFRVADCPKREVERRDRLSGWLFSPLSFEVCWLIAERVMGDGR